ncbi:hypothetical protein GQ42DRAFT_165786 [Ramicandelaber brevisporus]|nr:hypothetical protein GQ42DRAFT_165786 [Ramicandelaber brevisporus]
MPMQPHTSLLLSVSAAILAAFCYVASAQTGGSASRSTGSFFSVPPSSSVSPSARFSVRPSSSVSPVFTFSSGPSPSSSPSASVSSRDWRSSSMSASSSDVEDHSVYHTIPSNTAALIAGLGSGVLFVLVIAAVLSWRTRRERRRRVLEAAAESDGLAVHETPVNHMMSYHQYGAAAYNVESRLPQSQQPPPPYSPKPE